jgi:nucleoid-associated protein YejK
MLLGERVFWDPATDTLTIKGTPPNLRPDAALRQQLVQRGVEIVPVQRSR